MDANEQTRLRLADLLRAADADGSPIRELLSHSPLYRMLQNPERTKNTLKGLLSGEMFSNEAMRANPVTNQQVMDLAMNFAPLGMVTPKTGNFTVQSRGSSGHDIYEDGVKIGTVAYGKAKDAVSNFLAEQAKQAELATAKKLRYKENALKNASIKKDAEQLAQVFAEYGDVIRNAHKNQYLEFKQIPDEVFNSKANLHIYKSPAYGNKPGSAYKLAMVDGKPAYVRQSDHWGHFSTNDFVNGEPISKSYNWPLDGVKDKPFAGQRRTGYVFLEDLLK